MIFKAILTLGALVVSLSKAAVVTLGSMKYDVKLFDPTTIQFDVTCDTGTYCSMGFGTRTMSSSDEFVLTHDGTNGAVSDKWSTDHNTPVTDTT